jgi:hypothetical protein
MRGWRWALCIGGIATGIGCSLGMSGLGNAGPSGPDGQADDGAGDDALGDGGGPSPDGVVTNDAPTPDAPGDAPLGEAGDAGPSVCGDSGVLFCDGFENGGGNWNNLSGNGGHASIDGTFAYRGTHSMHAHTDMIGGGTPDAYALFGHSDPAWPSSLYVRVFVYFDGPYPGDPSAYLDLAQDNASGIGVQLNTLPMGPMVDYGENVYGGPNQQWQSMSTLPLKRWICVELFTDGTQMKTYVSDQPIGDLTQPFGQNIAPLQLLTVGQSFYKAHMQPMYDAWIDEVAVDGNYIRCSL